MNSGVTIPAPGAGEVGDLVAVALQAEAAAVEPEQVRVRGAVGLVALDAALHHPADDGAVGEPVGPALREVAASTDVVDIAGIDAPVRLMAVGALDALLVLQDHRVVAIETERALDLMVTAHADV